MLSTLEVTQQRPQEKEPGDHLRRRLRQQQGKPRHLDPGHDLDALGCSGPANLARTFVQWIFRKKCTKSASVRGVVVQRILHARFPADFAAKFESTRAAG